LNGRSPVIWVSDGQVTGSRGGTSRDLRQQTMAYIDHRKIHWVENPEEAIALLTKLQRGIRK
jgi:mannose-6-phosphate isomerase-like protein (cupin superfamily)